MRRSAETCGLRRHGDDDVDYTFNDDRGHDDMIRHGDDDGDYTIHDRCHHDMICYNDVAYL